MTSRSTEWLTHRATPTVVPPILGGIGLFALALAVRLPALGKFLTPDEFLWVDRSRNFLAGLLNAGFACKSLVEHTGFGQAEGLACTLRTGHPGVTTMWTGSLGILLRYLADGAPGSLFDYAVALPTNPLDARLIALERLPSVIFISLAVALTAWLVGRLFRDHRVGLVAGVLLALDPFHIALSRVIHHDALAATFMTLALLMALSYWTRRESRWWLVASGVCGGLAFLSKSSSLFLNPFILLLAGWSLLDHYTRVGWMSWRVWLGVVGDGLLWLACAVLAFCVAWPAMWVVPIDAVNTIFTIGVKYAGGGHAKGNFLLGVVSNDPGALFYPVTWLVRSTPLVWLGLAALALAAVRYWRDSGDSPSEHRLALLTRAGLVAGVRAAAAPILWLLLTYVALFLIFMTFGEKKQDRYILPIYPAVTVIAAVGLVNLISLARARGTRWVSLRGGVLSLVAVILIGHGYLTIANYPYFFTYYNPLLGGIRAAERMVTIGWGEGLDLAAEYLNQKPNAEDLRVAAWYQSTFAPYFRGTAISYSKEKGKALSGNYVIFYINQLQRRFPDDEMFRYFEERYEPEAAITLHGITYAVIYPAPGMQHYVEDRVDENRRNYRGIGALLGWDWPGAADPNKPAVGAGAALPFRLYWEYLGKRPEEQFFFRLIAYDGRLVAEGLSQPDPGDAIRGEPGSWREGQIIVETGSLPVPADTLPGDYRLQIGFYTRAPAVTEGELVFDLPDENTRVQVMPALQGG
jgi:4-amino-4-deoxy-L-arabinose transferase-like glycosyltransferase